jgi:ankyrin repeat protein
VPEVGGSQGQSGPGSVLGTTPAKTRGQRRLVECYIDHSAVGIDRNGRDRMGASFANCHVRTSEKTTCTSALKSAIRSRAMLTEPKNGWVTVYDETSESQDVNELRRIGKTISSKLKTTVFCFMVHDSDVFLFLLFDKGKLVDQFDSRPDYFGPATENQRRQWAGNAERLAGFAKDGVTVRHITKVLARNQVVEEDRVAEFAALMDIDKQRALIGFKHAQSATKGYEVIYGRGKSPLDAELLDAVSKRDVAAVRSLLDKGASPNQTDQFGAPLLVSAIRAEAMEIAESFVAAGADVLAEGKSKGDALWIASAEGHRKLLELLLNKARNDARVQKSLDVALGWSVLAGHLEIVTLLLASGANVNNPNEAGQTPLMLASLRGLEGAWEIRTKQQYPQRPDRPKTDWPKVVETLLRAAANPNQQTKDGVTALMAAAAQGYSEICTLLIKNGADITLKNKTGLTALDIANAGDHHSIAASLRAAVSGG